jgi:hypothetical protein
MTTHNSKLYLSYIAKSKISRKSQKINREMMEDKSQSYMALKKNIWA